MTYAKGILSLVLTVAVGWVVAAGAGPITTAGWFALGGSLLATVATVGLPNTPTSPAAKAVAQALAIVATGIGLLIDSGAGVTTIGVVPLLIQAAGVFGVYGVSNGKTTVVTG